MDNMHNIDPDGPWQYRFGEFCSRLRLCSLEQAAAGGDLVVADRNTAALLPAADVILEPGEQHKTWQQVERVIAACAARRLSRSGTVLAFGGGMLCDLAGFAAASYMRGCGLILVPTTLLAMVDAALGGKTGCNYQNYKNLIGAFYPAGEVRIVPEILASLPPREFCSGLAELCKHALLSESDDLWRSLQGTQTGQTGTGRKKISLVPPILAGDGAHEAAKSLSALLLAGVRVKGEIVQRDLYERGQRAFLNLGHTFAHALETVSAFACSHGEAVAWGIRQALLLSAELSHCKPDYAHQVCRLLQDLGFVLQLEQLCPELCAGSGRSELARQLVEAMQLDKKRSQKDIRLILQRGRGQTFIAELPSSEIYASLCRYA